MASYQVDLCILLLKEYFGEIVSKIGAVLAKFGPLPLNLIRLHSQESLINVKRTLNILIQHQIITFNITERGPIEYILDLDRVVLLIRYPKYIYISKILFGKIGECLLEELLKEGCLDVNSAVRRVILRLKKNEDYKSSVQETYNTFVKLAENRFIKKCAVLEEHDVFHWNPHFLSNQVTVPPLNFNLKDLDEEEEPKAKKRKLPGPNVYWSVDTEQFHSTLKDILIVDALQSHFGDTKASDLVRIILDFNAKDNPWAQVSSFVPKGDIIKVALDNHSFQNKDEIETYLSFMVQDNNKFVLKTDERAGVVTYAINVFAVMNKMINCCISSIVNDKLGPNSGRIFRLLLEKKILQQKQIEEMAMIPAKDAKECLFNLFKSGFVKLMQYPKQTDYIPSGTYFLFKIDIEEVSRNMLQKSYLALHNLILRRNYENNSNKALIERKTFIDAVIANLQMQSNQEDVQKQIEELNQSFSSHDKELLERLKKLSHLCEISEVQVDETCFIFQTWLSVTLCN